MADDHTRLLPAATEPNRHSDDADEYDKTGCVRGMPMGPLQAVSIMCK